MSSFDASEHSYGAPPRRPANPKGRRARRPGGGGVIAEDRRRIRQIKQKIAVALNLAIATGGLSAAVMAARKQDPKKLVKELREAEAKLRFDLEQIGAKKGGRRARTLDEVRRGVAEKTPQKAGQEAVAEQADTSGATADANDAAVADVPTADLVDADSEAASVPAEPRSSGSTVLVVLGFIGVGGAVAWKLSQGRRSA